jgi:hypothetical protein
MKPDSPFSDVATLTEFGRQRLSDNFFMREMLYSEVGNFYGVPNIPENPERALAVGRQVATRLLEPLKQAFGHVSIRSAYRSPTLNAFCNDLFQRGDAACWCTDNEKNAARHIWDRLDSNGYLGGTVTVFLPLYLAHYEQTGDFCPLAWWICDHVTDYAEVFFFRKLCAFNIRWYQGPSEKEIWFLDPPRRELLTRTGLDGHAGEHSALYANIISTSP